MYPMEVTQMKRIFVIVLLFAILTTNALAKGTKGHKGSHRPKHHGIVIKPIKAIGA
jgi:hypothetical protein